MKSDFEKRLERIRDARPQDEAKPDFSSSPIHSAPQRKQLLDEVLGAFGNHILGFRGPLWLRVMLRGTLALAAPALVMAAATILAEGTFEDANTPTEYTEAGTTLAKRAFSFDVIKAQFELGMIGLKLSTGTMSDEEAERYTANNSAEMRRLEKLANLED